MNSPKVLILRPGINAGGGVNYYFTSLQKQFPSNIDFIFRGARNYPYRSGVLHELLRIFSDYIRFIYRLSTHKYDLVHLNTTLDKRGVLRDVVYLVIVKLFRIKLVVFFRGWDADFQRIIEEKHKQLFLRAINSADGIITLFSECNVLLRSWGYQKPIFLETTTVDCDLTRSISKINLENKDYGIPDLSILYMARIEKEKGIYLCIDAINSLRKSHPEIELHIAGHGTEYENMVSYIREKEIRGIVIHGFVKDQAKIELLKAAHFFFFPTNYKEGMPNAVLEAMAFGLPVITRPVAGLKDIIIDGENGFVSESLNAEDFAELFRKSLEDRVRLKEISLRNFHQAKARFYSNVVAERLLNIYKTILDSQ